ncbi:MAG: hypothetical protein PHS44_01785 [Candidatus Dojkabacteria bacterium]|nr:hypothetical protein [Candidatus Dojkabacteria bacterium]
MNKFLISMVLIGIILSAFAYRADAQECYGQKMYAKLSYSVDKVKRGDTVELTILVGNSTYKEEYTDKDYQLNNPGVEIQSGSYKQYLDPSEDWVVPVPSMVNNKTLAYTKTYRIKDNAPLGYFGDFDVVTWLDKSDSSTLDHPTQGIAPLIITASDNSNTANEEQVQNGTETQNQGEETELKIRIHEKYLASNSNTTRLDQMTQKQLKYVENFTLHIPGKNMIMFKNILDLSSQERLQKLNNLDEHCDISKAGTVSLDSEYLDFLNKPAMIIMYNLPFNTTPIILKDGKPVTTDEVSNIRYTYFPTDGSGLLEFDVMSFSTYQVISESQFNQPLLQPDDTLPAENSLGRMLLLIGLITLIGIAVAVGVKLIERNRLSTNTIQEKVGS